MAKLLYGGHRLKRRRAPPSTWRALILCRRHEGDVELSSRLADHAGEASPSRYGRRLSASWRPSRDSTHRSHLSRAAHGRHLANREVRAAWKTGRGNTDRPNSAWANSGGRCATKLTIRIGAEAISAAAIDDLRQRRMGVSALAETHHRSASCKRRRASCNRYRAWASGHEAYRHWRGVARRQNNAWRGLDALVPSARHGGSRRMKGAAGARVKSESRLVGRVGMKPRR